MQVEIAEEGYFITATDTDMGKTFFTAALLREMLRRGISAVPMKPVASGAKTIDGQLRSDDAETLIAATTMSLNYADVNPYVFEPAIAPHFAAERAGSEIRLRPILEARDRLAAEGQMMLVEGVGGWKVPFGGGFDVECLARELNYPVVLVVGLKLGCINHALLTVDAILEGGCRLTGWVANEVDSDYGEKEETIDYLKENLPGRFLGKLSRKPSEDQQVLTEIKAIADVLTG